MINPGCHTTNDLPKFKNVPPFVSSSSSPGPTNTDIYKSAGGAAAKGPTASIEGWRNQTPNPNRQKPCLQDSGRQPLRILIQPLLKKNRFFRLHKPFQSGTICQMLHQPKLTEQKVRDVTLKFLCIIKYMPWFHNSIFA